MTRIGMERYAASQHGLAAVEFALILPVLLILMLATAELGRAMHQYNTLTKMVFDGARYLSDNSTPGSTDVIDVTSTVNNAARNLVVYGDTGGNGAPLLTGMTPADVTVSVVDATHVRVSAQYVYAPLLPVLPLFGLSPDDVVVPVGFQAVVTMRAL